jgi:ABC-type molybdate transport system ATPase subunit
VEERREAAMLPLQIAQHQETYEITQTDMDDQGFGAENLEIYLVEEIPLCVAIQ